MHRKLLLTLAIGAILCVFGVLFATLAPTNKVDNKPNNYSQNSIPKSNDSRLNSEITYTDITPGKPRQVSREGANPLPKEPGQYEVRLKQWLEAVIQDNNHTPNIYNLLFMALQRVNGNGEYEFQLAYSLQPDNVLINFQMLNHCLSDPELSYCALPFVDYLENIDGNNGVTLSMIVSHHFTQENLEEAFATLEKIPHTTKAHSYEANLVEEFDKISRRLEFDRNLLTQTIAYTTVVTLPESWHYSLHNTCQQQVDLQRWREACFRAFNHIETLQPLSISGIIASRLKESYRNLTPDQIKANREILTQQQQFILDSYSDSTMNALARIQNNERFNNISDTVWQEYLTIYREHGYLLAEPFLIETLIGPPL